MPRAVAFPVSSSISETSTQAPSSAKSSLMALPIPFAAPVTIATLSFNLSMITPMTSRVSGAGSAGSSRLLRPAKNSVRGLGYVTDQLVDVFVANLAQRSGDGQPGHKFVQLVEDRNCHAARFELLFFIVDSVHTLPDLEEFFSQQARRRDG